MATANTQKAKGDIWWQSTRAFGHESNSTTWRLARVNRFVSNPKLNGWGDDRLREEARWKFGVLPVGTANYGCHSIRNLTFGFQTSAHLAPTGVAGFVRANGSMSSNQSGEGEIRKAIIEVDLVDCMVALPNQLQVE